MELRSLSALMAGPVCSGTHLARTVMHWQLALSDDDDDDDYTAGDHGAPRVRPCALQQATRKRSSSPQPMRLQVEAARRVVKSIVHLTAATAVPYTSTKTTTRRRSTVRRARAPLCSAASCAKALELSTRAGGGSHAARDEPRALDSSNHRALHLRDDDDAAAEHGAPRLVLCSTPREST